MSAFTAKIIIICFEIAFGLYLSQLSFDMNPDRISAIICMLLLCAGATAQTPLTVSDLGESTKIAPAYFGPNAFPVPEMTDGKAYGRIYGELAGDYSKGRIGDGDDRTWNAFAKISLPLWTPRAELELWMPVVEYWDFSSSVASARRLNPERHKGHDSGDIYVCTRIHLVVGDEEGWRPDVMLRSVLKTASGNSYRSARDYDSAGYFFDGTVGKGLSLNGFITGLRAALSAGFLCWQTGTGRQNDAIMGGLLLSADSRWFKFTAETSGYWGWEHDGDFPVRSRFRLDIHPWDFPACPFLQVCTGHRDYPFTTIRAGVSLAFATN